MIAQYGIELRRLVHRRILFVSGILAVIALVIAGLSIWVSTGPTEQPVFTEDNLGQPVQSFETIGPTFCPSGLVTSYREEGYVADGYPAEVAPDPTIGCPASTPESIEQRTTFFDAPAMYHPWNGSIAYFTVAVMVLLWILSASMIGEEFRHGTVETALVAEPRRGRLLVLRLAAVLTVGVAAYLVLATGFVLANVPAWVTRGIDGTSVAPDAIVAAIGRGALAALLVVALSASLAVIGRGTMLSLGVLLALTVVAAVFFLFAKALVPVEFFTNVFAVITGGDGMHVWTIEESFGARPVYGGGWSWVGALGVVAGYVGAAIVVAFASFTRRDVK